MPRKREIKSTEKILAPTGIRTQDLLNTSLMLLPRQRSRTQAACSSITDFSVNLILSLGITNYHNIYLAWYCFAFFLSFPSNSPSPSLPRPSLFPSSLIGRLGIQPERWLSQRPDCIRWSVCQEPHYWKKTVPVDWGWPSSDWSALCWTQERDPGEGRVWDCVCVRCGCVKLYYVMDQIAGSICIHM